MIGSGPSQLENKHRGVARNTWSLFPVPVIDSFVCETNKIDICAFPYYKYSSAFARFESMDSSSKSYADAVGRQETNSWWRKYQAEDEEEAMLIAIQKSREIVKVTVVSLLRDKLFKGKSREGQSVGLRMAFSVCSVKNDK